MSVKRFAAAVVLAATASTGVAQSMDATIALIPGTGSFSAAFGASKTESGIFVDNFTFELPGISGNAAVTFDAISPNIGLVIATLSDGNRASDSPPEGVDQGTVLSLLGVMGPLTLSILGAVGDPFAPGSAINGSYSGSITFSTLLVPPLGDAPVPLPATMPLLLVGLAMAGLPMRRRALAARA